jgi:hypothetical protein
MESSRGKRVKRAVVIATVTAVVAIALLYAVVLIGGGYWESIYGE